MPMFNSLLKTLQDDHKDLVFRPGKKFLFRPPKTIFYYLPTPEEDQIFALRLLHELSHAELKHFDFKTNVARLKMESDAWAHAKKLANQYAVPFDDALAEADLDSYRDWLHTKSKCKKCGLTRFETPDGKWHCPFCDKKI